SRIALFVSGWIVASLHLVQAQQITGALAYHELAFMVSDYQYIGTARIQGLGNTQISLGGDISSALSNPAGLGFYNRSEFSITPSYNIFTSNTNYLGSSSTSNKGKFNFDNLGIVFNKMKDDAAPGSWRGRSFAISLAKVNEFNSRIEYQGMNANNDILDFYAQDANKQNVAGEELTSNTSSAFQTYLISEFLDGVVNGRDTTLFPFYNRTFFSEYPSAEFPTNQSEIISTSGSQNQINLSYGGNFGDKIYFGFGLGIPTVRYTLRKEYSEVYPGLQGDIVGNMNLTEELNSNGVGINGTFGIIVRPVNQVTLGFSLITPSAITMSETYFSRMEAGYNNFDMGDYGDYFDANYDLIANPDVDFTTFYSSSSNLNEEFYEQESSFNYKITTPLRVNGGISFFLLKNGFITADVEYVDYSNMKVNSTDDPLTSANESINSLYGSVVNYRVGAEWRYKSFRVRGGYNHRQNPYSVSDVALSRDVFSGGLGFRSTKFFMDITVSYGQWDNEYAPYVLDNPNNEAYLETPIVGLHNSNLNMVASFGLFF
ncbi:MAG TPA: hypothetical protein VER35_03170, partial [Candidatus Limnocylindrales bacterium]|nr:hypothetical protein [Candidatus Limnocylindrales bacterium]